ncbi:MAG: hypothetical protein NC253_15235 [Ruminococcus sp.]|nr:hypothetical protein [Ruminococcus sp.]MCM1480420.1 hypothetical protein [Muribaculaceae bacterium]
MVNSYAANLGKNYSPDPNENVFDSIFREYEHVIFESIVTSFGLDFIVKDRHGGDVDTIHNVRQIGNDPDMVYKNKENEKAYENRGEYSYFHKKKYGNGYCKNKEDDYHDRNAQYSQKKSETRKNAENGVITDEYTGKNIAFAKAAPENLKASLDHVIAANDIHEDRGRVLSELSGTDLANSPENLKFTNQSLNSSMQEKQIPEYIKNHPELPEETKKNMMDAYNTAKSAYENKLAKAYYTSPKFIKDSASAAGKLGVQMGLRQVLGFFFANVWCAIREEFEKAELEWGLNLDLGDFFTAISNGAKRGLEETMSVETFKKFIDGGIAGILSSLTTTICNIFFTTAKNVVKIIRQSYASIVQAAKVLLINPDGYLFGDRMLAAAKIIAAGASIVVGSTVSIALEGTALGQIPVIGDIVQTFLGSLVTGVMSCTLLLFLDRSKVSQNLVNFLNNIDKGIDKELANITQQAEYFESYAAQLMDIDINAFQVEIAVYSNFTDELLKCDNDESLNLILKNITEKLGIKLPWTGDFDEFMGNRNNTLVFE